MGPHWVPRSRAESHACWLVLPVAGHPPGAPPAVKASSRPGSLAGQASRERPEGAQGRNHNLLCSPAPTVLLGLSGPRGGQGARVHGWRGKGMAWEHPICPNAPLFSLGRLEVLPPWCDSHPRSEGLGATSRTRAAPGPTLGSLILAVPLTVRAGHLGMITPPDGSGQVAVLAPSAQSPCCDCEREQSSLGTNVARPWAGGRKVGGLRPRAARAGAGAPARTPAADGSGPGHAGESVGPPPRSGLAAAGDAETRGPCEHQAWLCPSRL